MQKLSNMNTADSFTRPDWPDDRPYSGAGYQRVGGTVSCVLTRFGLPSVFSLGFFFLAFRRIRKESLARIDGLIEAVFLVEWPRTCYTLSLWTDDNAILDFNGRIISHITSANWALVHVFNKHSRRPEVWSVQWRLWAVSNNLNWDAVNLREILAEQLRSSTVSSSMSSMNGE